MQLPSARPLLGIWPAIQARALTGNRPIHPSTHRVQAGTQSTEPHQPGLKPHFKKIFKLFIERKYSLAQTFMFHSSGMPVSEKLPRNSPQRNSLHSKITLYSARYQPSSCPQNLSWNPNFCINLPMPSFLVQLQETSRKLQPPGIQAWPQRYEITDAWPEGHASEVLSKNRKTW